MRTLFEVYGIEYQEYGDHLIPNVALPKTDEIYVGVWAQRYKRYLKEHHRILYYNLLTKGQLYEYLSDIEERAKTMYEDLINYPGSRPEPGIACLTCFASGVFLP